MLWVLLITLTLQGAPPHSIYGVPGMPLAVCEDLADRLNIPLLLPRSINVTARCVTEAEARRSADDGRR